MESTLNQPYIFLATVYGGIILGLIYDIYRGIRIMFNRKKAITIIFDVLFVLSALVISAGVLYIVNSGELRLYTFIGFVLGFALYMVGLSPLFTFLAKKGIDLIFKKDKPKDET
jgi:spore cortex biosynthesis protein YabQ